MKQYIFIACLSMLLISLPACIMQETPLQRRDRIESTVLNIRQQYKKELKVVEGLKQHRIEPQEQMPHELREVILMKFERADFPLIQYKTYLDQNIARLKNMIRDVMSIDSPVLFENIKQLRRNLKLINRFVVTSKDFWKEKKAYKQARPTIVPVPLPIPVATEQRTTVIEVYE